MWRDEDLKNQFDFYNDTLSKIKEALTYDTIVSSHLISRQKEKEVRMNLTNQLGERMMKNVKQLGSKNESSDSYQVGKGHESELQLEKFQRSQTSFHKKEEKVVKLQLQSQHEKEVFKKRINLLTNQDQSQDLSIIRRLVPNNNISSQGFNILDMQQKMPKNQRIEKVLIDSDIYGQSNDNESYSFQNEGLIKPNLNDKVEFGTNNANKNQTNKPGGNTVSKFVKAMVSAQDVKSFKPENVETVLSLPNLMNTQDNLKEEKENDEEQIQNRHQYPS